MTRSAVFACLLAVIAGCSAGKTDMEKSVKQEMKTALNVEITAVSLTKQSDGGYSGTATAANGDTYDVTATAPSSDGRFEWKAVVTQSTVERMLRDHLKTTMTIEVSALDLKKQPDGGYTGTANAANGDTYEVTAGAPAKEGIALGVVPGQSTVERMVSEDIEKQTKAKIKSFALTRKGPGTYTGTATQENGGVLVITTKLDGQNLTWTFRPLRPR